MSDTRANDRIDIGKARDSATTTKRKEHYDRMLSKINSESKTVNSLRENLIKAVRGGDHRAKQYYYEKLQKYGR